ncbi:MAG: leucine-rich repeat protein [Clostridia bacterium]|nr:leucine-rich repeat protein [Clostridia bacterium]
MKRVKLGLTIFFTVILVTVISLCMVSLASEEKFTIKFYDGSELISEVMAASGESISFPTVDTGALNHYGWFDKEGNLYDTSASLGASADMSYYLAKGKAISTSAGFVSAISNGYTYIKLNSNITINQTVSLLDQITYIDLNTNKITLNTSNINNDVQTTASGFSGNNSGLIFGGAGSVIHTASGIDESMLSQAVLSVSPTDNAHDNITLVVRNGVSITTNMCLFNVNTDVSNFDSIVNVDIYGSIDAQRLTRSNGMKNATLDIYSSSSVAIRGEYIFDDYKIIEARDDLVLKATIHGGVFNVSDCLGYARSTSDFKVIILGGSFSKDIADFFPNKNYVFTKNGDYYDFLRCNHVGQIIGAVVGENPCTECAYADYKCDYCDVVELQKEFPEGIGHSFTFELTKDIVNTEESTEPGEYTYTCKICGETEIKYFYPDPSSVYVSIGYINKDNELTFIRVPAKDLYSFDEANGKEIMSFSTAVLEYDYNISQDKIYSVELPLGATGVNGDYKNSTEQGVFMRANYIEEIILPRSLVNIDQYAFYLMDSLVCVKGLEYVTGTIGKSAFEQTTAHLYFEHMVLNAKTISEKAFKNALMKTLTIGRNVSSVEAGAFELGEDYESVTIEIIVDGNLIDKTTMKIAMGNKGYSDTNQQFGGNEIVYTNHDYVFSTIAPSCSMPGQEGNKCSRCDLWDERTVVEIATLPHNYKHVTYASTCRVKGYEVDKCVDCEYENPDSVYILPLDYNAHVYTHAEVIGGYVDKDGNKLPEGYVCENKYYTLGQCACLAVEPDIPSNRSKIYNPLPTGHEWDKAEIEVIEEVTCSSVGKQIQKCPNCGRTKTTYVRPEEVGIEHSPSNNLIVVTPADCTDTGQGYYECQNLNNKGEKCTYKRYVTIRLDATNHVPADTFTVATPATTERSGQEYSFCTKCATIVYREIPKLERVDEGTPGWVIALIVIGSVLLVGGVGVTFYFTFTKKKNKSQGFTYHFNTLNK